MTLPTLLTIARLCLIPFVFALFLLEPAWGAFAAWVNLGVYVAGAVTDFLDGYLARKMNAITPLGTLLDPIADKVFVACVLVMLVAFGRLPDFWVIPVLIILSREFLVAALREFLGPKNVQLPVTKLAKWKTALQMIAIGFLMVGPYAPYTLTTGQWGLSAAALITVITGWIYMKAGLKHL